MPTKSFNSGTTMMAPFKMSAGQELDMYLEMDYNRVMAKDASIVAWGDKGDLCIEHTGGIKSDHFKVLKPPK